MSRLLPLFAPARYSLPLLPTLLSARPYSNQPTCTRYLIRQPSPFAPRESPTPLIFVRAHGLRLASASGPPGGSDTSRSAGDAAVGTGPGDTEWKDWSGMFAEKGFTSIEIDITVPTQDPDLPASATQEGSTLETLASAVTALSSQIRLQAIPFPPVLVAQGPSTLLTQAYISDHPASGLVMLDPVDDERFTYEPNFPILLLGKEEGRVRAGRIGAMAKDVGRGGKGVRVVGVGDVRGEEGRMSSSTAPTHHKKFKQWKDEVRKIKAELTETKRRLSGETKRVNEMAKRSLGQILCDLTAREIVKEDESDC